MIGDQKKKSIFINILHKLNHMYSNHNSNIKYVDSIIQYIGFNSIHYTINLDVVPSFIVFSDFNYMFISMYC